MNMGFGDGAFLASVREQYKQYLPEGAEFPFKNLGSASLVESHENLKKAYGGEHGGLEYEDYRRFLEVLAKEVVDRLESSIKREKGEHGFQFIKRMAGLEGEYVAARGFLMKITNHYDLEGLREILAAAGSVVKKREGPSPLDHEQNSKVFVYTDRVHQDKFSAAIAKGDTEAMGDLSAKGVPLDGPRTWRQDRPLFEAARYGQIEAARALLDAGANQDLASRRHKGLSLIAQAALHNQTEFFKFMLTRGADPGILLTEKVGPDTVFDIVQRNTYAGDEESRGIWNLLKDLGKSGKVYEQGKGMGKLLKTSIHPEESVNARSELELRGLGVWVGSIDRDG